VAIEVLGTDLLEHSLGVARRGHYGAWSHRLAGPILFPVCGPKVGRDRAVLDHVRGATRFEKHNILGPPPGEFDIVVCRNVLLYFCAEAARRATGHIVRSLAPGGVAIFGTLDVTGAPDGLTRVGRSELNIFAHPGAENVAPRRRSTKPPRGASIPPPSPGSAGEDVGAEVGMHLRLLASIERGDRRGAGRELLELRRNAPDYLPGLFEQALSFVRHGDRHEAVGPMQDLLQRLESIPPETLLPGPEHLPVSYYQTAARAFLATAEPGLLGDTPEPARPADASRARSTGAGR
jgi:chemotaxis protein methyltransferase CheR